MKIVTANLLSTGRVVYLANDNSWADDLSRATLFTDEQIEDVQAQFGERSREIADIYVIEADDKRQPAGRSAYREKIRSTGPSFAYLDFSQAVEGRA